MDSFRKFASLFLQICGLLFLGLVGFITFGLLKGFHSNQITDTYEISGSLSRAGIEPNKSTKVIFGQIEFHPWLNDYERYFCVEIDVFSPREQVLYNWLSGADDPVRNEILKYSNIYNFSQKCFGNIELKELQSFTIDARFSSEESNADTNLLGFEVLFYDPGTKRLLFYGMQT